MEEIGKRNKKWAKYIEGVSSCVGQKLCKSMRLENKGLERVENMTGWVIIFILGYHTIVTFLNKYPLE